MESLRLSAWEFRPQGVRLRVGSTKSTTLQEFAAECLKDPSDWFRV